MKTHSQIQAQKERF